MARYPSGDLHTLSLFDDDSARAPCAEKSYGKPAGNVVLSDVSDFAAGFDALETPEMNEFSGVASDLSQSQWLGKSQRQSGCDVQPDFDSNGNLDVFLSEEEKVVLREQWRNTPIAAFAQWIASSEVNGARGFAERTQCVYLSMWTNFVKVVGQQHAAMADARQIQAFLSGLHGRLRRDILATGRLPSAHRSVRRYLLLLSMVQKHLVRISLRTHTVAGEMLTAVGRETRKPVPVALSDMEEGQLRAVVSAWPADTWRDRRDGALLWLLIGSGIKVSEVQSLTVADVRLDISPSEILVRTARLPRKAPLSIGALPAMADWLAMRKTAGPDATLFPGELEAVMSASTIYRVVARAMAQADLNPLHTGPSVLRHTFATRQLRAGKPLKAVSHWLGHKDPTSTDVYYRMVVDPRGFSPI
jgi:site-specific recombinase XerD